MKKRISLFISALAVFCLLAPAQQISAAETASNYNSQLKDASSDVAQGIVDSFSSQSSGEISEGGRLAAESSIGDVMESEILGEEAREEEHGPASGAAESTSPETLAAVAKSSSEEAQYQAVGDLLETVAHNAYVVGSGGKFYPNSVITRAQAAQMFYNLLKEKGGISGKEFSDVQPGQWYEQAVRTLAGLSIIQGVSDTKYEPNRAITREEFVTIAARFAKIEAGGNSFSDVSTGSWAHPYIVSATAKGWLLGYGDGTFRPKNKISRAEAVTVINRMTNRVPDSNIKKFTSVTVFADVPKTSWAYAQITEAATTHDYLRNPDGTETWLVAENDFGTWETAAGGYQCRGRLSGELKTGFQEIEGQVYYFDPATQLLKKGWQTIGGKHYLLADKGESIASKVTNTKLTQVNYNQSDRSWEDIDYIVVHYTASPGDTAQGEANYFYSEMRYASAHYFVDEKSVWQVVKDSDMAWHVGNLTYTHEAARNKNSIGIEMCCKKSSGYTSSISAYDNDWYFLENTEKYSAELVRSLMKKYAVPIEDVIRHADVTQKVCPAQYVLDYSKWQNFLKRVTKNEVTYSGDYAVRLQANVTVYSGPGTGNSTVGTRKANDIVTVYEERQVAKNSDGRWARIGTNQWIQIKYVSRL